MRLTARTVELAVARHFNHRTNVIVPNVFWGMGLLFEVDLVVLRPSGLADEVEIKVTAADIRKDKTKKRNNEWFKPYMSSPLFARKWFAVPAKLADSPDIPADVGILSVTETECGGLVVTTVRAPKLNPNRKVWTEAQRRKLTELGCMRIWALKKALDGRLKDLEHLRKELKQKENNENKA